MLNFSCLGVIPAWHCREAVLGDLLPTSRDIKSGVLHGLTIWWRSVVRVIRGLISLVWCRVEHGHGVGAIATTRRTAATHAAADTAENRQGEDYNGDDDADYDRPPGEDFSTLMKNEMGCELDDYILAIGLGHAKVPSRLRVLMNSRERVEPGLKDCHDVCLIRCS